MWGAKLFNVTWLFVLFKHLHLIDIWLGEKHHKHIGLKEIGPNLKIRVIFLDILIVNNVGRAYVFNRGVKKCVFPKIQGGGFNFQL